MNTSDTSRHRSAAACGVAHCRCGQAAPQAPLLLLALALAAGCAAPAPLPSQALADATEALEPRGPMPASDLFIARSAAWPYEFSLGEQDPGPLVLQRRPTDRFDAQWQDLEGDLRTTYWRMTDGGALEMTAVLDHREQALSRFDPPLTIAPAELAPGEAYHAESRMRVVSSHRPEQLRARGTASNAIEYLDDRLIQTPLGEHRARRVVVRFRARLNVADATRETVLYIVPEIGVVAAQATERITALGLFRRTINHRLILRSAPVAE